MVLVDPQFYSATHFYANGLLTSVLDEMGFSENYWSDGDRNLTKLEDRSGNYWNWTYDLDGNCLTALSPSLDMYTYTYNSDNNLTIATDPMGQEVTLDYNYPSHGHFYLPHIVRDDNGAEIAHFYYNLATGDLTSATNVNQVGSTLTYDTYGNVVGCAMPDGTQISAT